MPSTCEFKMEKPNQIYYAGEENIIGTIILKTTNDKLVKCLDIGLKGIFKTTNVATPVLDASSSEQNARVRNAADIVANVYFATFKRRVHDSGILKAGTYNWDFCFSVPGGWFKSLDERNGHLRYELFLKIKNHTKYNNVFLNPVTVIEYSNVDNDESFNICD